MRDPRYDPYTDAEIIAGALLPPTHPDGPRKMRPVAHPDELGPDAAQLAFYGEEQVASIRRDLPRPPPAELGFDPVKWQAMSRAERRAVLRHAKGLK